MGVSGGAAVGALLAMITGAAAVGVQSAAVLGALGPWLSFTCLRVGAGLRGYCSRGL